ncbi:MAG: Rieske (2Fe-2S) protein [Nitrosopumilus sp.]|jgi:nitrite reductase/ring-hydroxylating ferredoxin subunit|nr:Rieske (2Fe-2S) protein [Nitrosopumilus sp.]
MESIFLSDTDYEQLASQTEDLIAKVDDLPYPKVKDDVQALLQNFDMLHREALTRLFKEIIINYPALHSKMENDKAVYLLFSLYDLFHSDIHNEILLSEDFGGNGDQYPRWIPVGNANELKENTAYKYAEEGEVVLICKTEGTVYAVKNCCGNTALPLDGAAIEKGYLICPWHGCAYRLSDGVMETNPMNKLKKYPLTIGDEGVIRLGLNM